MSSARTGVCVVAGVVSACVAFVPYLLSALVSSMMGVGIAFRGGGGLLAVIVVQAFEIALLAGSTAVSTLVVRYALAALNVPFVKTELLGASLGAALGVVSAMVMNGTLAIRASIPAVQFAGDSRGIYLAAGPALGVVGAAVGIAIVARGGDARK